MAGYLGQCVEMMEVVKRYFDAAEELLQMKIEAQAVLPNGKMIDLFSLFLASVGLQPVLEGDIFYVRR
jgi:hypothetical protein